MSLKFIDVILPNYNKGKFLEESICSVINQSYKNWKLYIVDDNSNDESDDIPDFFEDFLIKKTIIIKSK